MLFEDREQTVSEVAFRCRVSHRRTSPSRPPQAKRFDMVSPATIISLIENVRAPLLRTFDKTTVHIVSCVTETLDRALRNKPVVANFKLEFSMGNLQYMNRSSSIWETRGLEYL